MKPGFLLIHTRHALCPHIMGTFPTARKNFPKSDSNSFHLAQTTQSHVNFSPFHLLHVFGNLAILAGDGQYGESAMLWLSLSFDCYFLFVTFNRGSECSSSPPFRVLSRGPLPPDPKISTIFPSNNSLLFHYVHNETIIPRSGFLGGFSPGFKGCKKDADGPTSMMGKEVFLLRKPGWFIFLG